MKQKQMKNLIIGMGILAGIVYVVNRTSKMKKVKLKQEEPEKKQNDSSFPTESRKYITLGKRTIS